MSLPIIQSDISEFLMMQTRWASVLNQVLDIPLIKGITLKNVSLLAATNPNVINHLLGRNLQGWIITRIRAQSTVWDNQDSNQNPSLTLFLRCSADVVIDLFVF